MQPVLLIILDGFGEGKKYPGNAIAAARTPNISALKKEYPWTLLKASGDKVGVPAGTQGGSEIGHFTIGAGRIIFQSLEKINRAIANGDFFENPALTQACDKAKTGALHLIGMISDQGVHSHINHLFALLELAKRRGVEKVYVHAITDGRDVPGRSAQKFIKQIQEKNAAIATIVGRYFAMDRDSNLDRTQRAYNLLTKGGGVFEIDPQTAVENAYKRGVETDYYIDPIILDKNGVIKDGDAAIFWNFRTDRARQLTKMFTDAGKVHFACMGPFSQIAPVAFPTPIVKKNLGEIISDAGLKQLRIAETEKYAHVTYFFNSQAQRPFPGEDRLLINSPKCPSYAEKPEMSAREITAALLPKLESKKYALIVLNFANCDLVGHSGEMDATVKAVETIDECIGKIIPVALENNYATLITGDHGNAEYMIYDDGSPCPTHTTNPVPLMAVGENLRGKKLKKNGELKDIAPTILGLIDIKQPPEMTGKNLLVI